MKMLLIYILILTCALLSAQDVQESDLQIEIKLVELDSTLVFDAYVTNIGSENLELEFEFLLIKRSKSGSNTNRQSNKFIVERDKVKSLGQIRIPIETDLAYEARLLIYSNNNLVTSTSLESKRMNTGLQTNPNDNKSTRLVAKDANLEFGTFILDQTRTRIGREFYEIFYTKWQQTNISAEVTLLIQEQFLRARNSSISISVDDVLIFSSNLQPRYDVIEQIAEGAVYRVARYIQSQINTQKDIDNEKTFIQY